MENFDGILITVFGYDLWIHQSIMNWVLIGLVICIVLIILGKKFEHADPKLAPKGILLIAEMLAGLCRTIVGDNLKDKTNHYLPFFGTLVMMMVCSNLLGLIGLQPPTSNLGLNVTLAIIMFLLIQYNGIHKAGIKARLKELTEPMWLLTPLNVIGEFALPISLSMRLFGNILAGSIITMLIYMVIKSLSWFGILGFVVTPLIHSYFDIFSGLIQTYIFFTLASFFLSQQVVEEED